VSWRPVVAAATCAAALWLAAPAGAAFDACTYDVGTRTVTATLGAFDHGRLAVAAGGAIAADGVPCDDATTANTDAVTARSDEPERTTTEDVTIDESGPGGPFVKPGTDDEIPIEVDLGEFNECFIPECEPDIPQRVHVIGTPGADDIRVGREGDALLVNVDAGSDFDTDIRARGHFLLPELDGRGGADTLTGLGGAGAGIDPVTVVLRGGPGGDRLAAGAYDDVIYPGGGPDSVNASPYGRDVVSYADAPRGVTASLYSGEVANDGFGATDQLDTRDLSVLYGSEHADHLESRYGAAATVHGRGGDDVIVGSTDTDTLYGDRGADRIDAGTNGWSADGDYLYGGPGPDYLRGRQGSDTLIGGAGADVLEGGGSNDLASIDTAGDQLDGGPGSDLLEGGHGNDIYGFTAPAGHEVDTIYDPFHQGRDTIRLNYDNAYHGRPPIPTYLNLSSTGHVFGRSGRRTFRALHPGGASQIEDFLDLDYNALDRIVGNDADNVIEMPEAAADSTADCRGGRDRVAGVALSRAKNCEIVN
jgi:Ca2+-binding RTX toxin-like protein